MVFMHHIVRQLHHGERTACILSDDAASFTFQQRNVTSAWINGNEYANPQMHLTVRVTVLKFQQNI